jgi:two-component system chemotaxis sensor kinase CheA
VHSDKLDALINRVASDHRQRLGQRAGHAQPGPRRCARAVSVMSRLTEDVRDGAMRLRMVEIGDTFNRFRRVVRDVSKDLGKEIELHISGGDTELDKSVVDRLGDPLTHLMRNAMDHGLEPRGAAGAGKPRPGGWSCARATRRAPS